jgi:hypothetical protein
MLFLWVVLGGLYGWAHNGLHSTTRLIFTHSDQEIPIVQSNWGFFLYNGSDWRWLCPEALRVTDLYFLEVDTNYNWWVGTVDGLWKSPNQCEFSRIAFEGAYVSQIDWNEESLYVSTATGFSDNSLWKSDNGIDFFEVGFFGSDTRIYGFEKTNTGMWALTLEEEGSIIWWKEEGGTWVPFSLSEQVDGWIEVLQADDERLWFSATSTQSVLWSIDRQGSLDSHFASEVRLQSFARIQGKIVVGGDEGFFVSSDNGSSWSNQFQKPETACLVTQQDYLYSCTHNWNDGAAVMRTQGLGEPETWVWESVFSFSEVVGVVDCPQESPVSQYCSLLWEAGVQNGGFSDNITDLEESAGCAHRSSSIHLWLCALFLILYRKSNSDVGKML